MEFKSNKTNRAEKAFELIQFLERASKKKELDQITNFDEVIEVLEDLLQDYELSLSQLESNHIEH